MELCSAYTAFAAGGWLAKPMLVKSVVDHDGKILEQNVPAREQVLDEPTAYLVTWALNQAMIEGTGKTALALGMTGGFAGKTGTTEEGRDAWFIGYSPRILCGVWVGDDTPRASGLSGPGQALPLWMAFIRLSSLNLQVKPFAIPPEILFKKIDEDSGLLARSGCPHVATMPFVDNTAPTAYCPNHPGGVIGLLKRWFGAPVHSGRQNE
jgi:penicillin-binding protein 1A